MPLTFATPPADASGVLLTGLREISETQNADPRGGAKVLALPAAPKAMRPHPIYELSLADLAEGKGFDSARLVAWRYLLVENEQIRQAAEIIPDAAHGSRFGSLTTGYVAGAAQAFALAENMPEIVAGCYEMRAFQVPSLYLMALWLKHSNGVGDRFIPLPPVFPPFHANVPLSGSELLHLLRRQAESKLALELRLPRQEQPPPS